MEKCQKATTKRNLRANVIDLFTHRKHSESNDNLSLLVCGRIYANMMIS